MSVANHWTGNAMLTLKDLQHNLNELVRSAIITSLISSSKQSPKVLFDSINNTVSPSTTSPCHSQNYSDMFHNFLLDKIMSLRSSIQPGLCLLSDALAPPLTSTSYSSFHSVS